MLFENFDETKHICRLSLIELVKEFENCVMENDIHRSSVVLKSDFNIIALATYSTGPQMLRIPLSDIPNILKPEYR